MSDFVWLHRRQLTRLPHPWDSPGKNTGVGCHFLLQCVKVKSLSRIWLLATPWTAARQAPPSTVFSRQEYWSGLPFPSPVRCLSEVNCPPLMWVDFIQSVEYLNRTKKLNYRERLLPVYLSRNIGPLLPSDLNWSISSSWVLSLPYIWTNLHYHLSGVSRCLTVDLGTSHLFKSILFL